MTVLPLMDLSIETSCQKSFHCQLQSQNERHRAENMWWANWSESLDFLLILYQILASFLCFPPYLPLGDLRTFPSLSSLTLLLPLICSNQGLFSSLRAAFLLYINSLLLYINLPWFLAVCRSLWCFLIAALMISSLIDRSYPLSIIFCRNLLPIFTFSSRQSCYTTNL